MADDEAMRIAAGLTKAQRAFLNVEDHHFARGYKPGEKLVELGALQRTRGNFGDKITLSPLGRRVRAVLVANRSDQ